MKSLTFTDHQTLSTSYDNRMRPSSWNVSNVLGYNYSYLEHTEKVNYARNVYDGTLDRSYEYDQVGALVFAHSGAEARAAFGIDGTQWGNSNGPYSHWYDYDKQGNMIQRFGWGGEVQGGAPYGGDTNKIYTYSNGKNQRDGLGYDAAGNLKDGESNQHYIYNAIGQQTNAWQVNGYNISQGYDGDGLRGVKWENETPTYYLRSSVLGGAVVAELDGSGTWTRGYYYRGDQLLAVQQSGHMYWVHEDAITKSQRTTDVYGAVTPTGVVELDPWGANTARSSATVFQPQNFTGYTRDGNGDQDAKARRYSPTGRFPQPDPSGGSYDFSNPQSLNRYAYVGNDPVNFRDPSGMEMQSSFCGAEFGYGQCGNSWGSASSMGNGWGHDPHPGRDIIREREMQFDILSTLGHHLWGREGHSRDWHSDFDVAVDTRGIRKYLEKFLRSGSCGTFVENLINQLGTNTGTPFKSDYLLDLFDQITNDEGGIKRGGSSPGTLESPSIAGKWTILIGLQYSAPTTALARRSINESDAQVVLHELVHFAASTGFYSDAEAATAAADVLKRNDAPRFADYVGERAKMFGHDTSAYFDSRLKENCPSTGVH